VQLLLLAKRIVNDLAFENRTTMGYTAPVGSLGRSDVKNRNMIVLAILALTIATLSCEGSLGFKTVRGSGSVEEKTYEVSGFSSVDLATIGKLVVETGETEALRVEAEENLLKYFEVKVHDGELGISDRENVNLVPTKGVFFYLTVKELETITISGLGDVELPAIAAPEFSIEISGGGNVDIEELTADVLEVEISGLGNLSVDGGTAGQQEIVITGGGSYRARHLDSAVADVQVNGLGKATVRVRDRLDVTISGGGSVEYFGDPSVDQDVSGVGHVKRIGD
jgi:hypothetical protein